MIVKHGKLAAIDHVITDGLTVSGDGVRLPVGLQAELVKQIEKINPIETFVKEHSAFSGVGGINVHYDDTADTWIVSAGELSAYVTHEELSAALANYYTSEEIDENFYDKNEIDENFYTKSEIESSYYDIDEMSAKYYDKVEVDELVNRLGGYKKVPYDDINHCPLVDDPQTKYIYLTKPTSAISTSAKDEYEAWIWSVSSEESSAGYWECIDETSVNLDGYATKQWVEQQGYLKEQEQSDWIEDDPASASYIKNKPEVLPLNAKYGIVLNGTASGVDIGIRRSLLDAKLDVSAVSSITINPSAISAYLAEKLDISAFASYSASIIQDFIEVATELNNKVDKTAFESYSATVENEISTLSANKLDTSYSATVNSQLANKLDTSATNDWDTTEYSGGSGINIENHVISVEGTKLLTGDDKNIAVVETSDSIIISAMKDFVDADFVASAIAAVDVTSAISAKLDTSVFNSYSANVNSQINTISAEVDKKLDSSAFTSATSGWDVDEYVGSEYVNITNHEVELQNLKEFTADEQYLTIVETDSAYVVSALKDFVDKDYVDSAIASASQTSAIATKLDKLEFYAYSADIDSILDTYSAEFGNKLDTSATAEWDITPYSGSDNISISANVISLKNLQYLTGDNKNITIVESNDEYVISATKDFVDKDYVDAAIAAIDVTSALSAKLDITAFNSYSADVDDVLETLSADFANYYTKSYIDSAYYTQTEVDDLIKDFGGFNVVTKDAQGYPDVADPNSKFIYLTLDTSAAAASAKDVFEEWIYTNNAWKCIGEASLNLEGYATQDWVTNQHYLTQQVQADWSEVDPTSASYIANKPTVYSGSAAGLVPSGTSTDHDKFLRGDGTWETVVTDMPDFVGATSSTSGVRGVVPAPASGDEDKFLKGDGTWDFVKAVTISYDAVSGELHLDFSHVNN